MTAIISILILQIIIFIICRTFILWYFKIPEIIHLLQKINLNLNNHESDRSPTQLLNTYFIVIEHSGNFSLLLVKEFQKITEFTPLIDNLDIQLWDAPVSVSQKEILTRYKSQYKNVFLFNEISDAKNKLFELKQKEIK